MKIQLQTETLTIFESALFRTTSTVIQTSDFIMVIDPNWLPHEVEYIRQFVKNNQHSKPLYLFFTHSDYDHIIGYQAFSDATVIISKAFEDNSEKAAILEQINAFDDDYYIQRNYEITYPKGDIVIAKNGEKVQIGGTTLQFFNAAGHNSDGLLLWIEALGILVVGDYLSNVEFPYIYHSGRQYLQTLNTAENIIRHQKVQFLITGHGDYTTKLDEMQVRLEDSRKYISDVMTCIKNKETFDITQLWKQYHFPRSMTNFHKGNLKVLQKEV